MADVFYNFTYDGTIEGLFCVFLRCISTRVYPKSIRDVRSFDGRYEADNYLYIKSDRSLALSFYEYIGRFASCGVQQMVIDCFLTSLPNKEMDMYMLIRQALWRGSSVEDDFTHDGLRRVQMAIRDLYRESQGLYPELQFHSVANVQISVISPRNIVLPVMMDNVLNDVRLDDFMLYDSRHRLLLLRSVNKDYIVDTGNIPSYADNHPENLYDSFWEYLVCDGRMRRLRPIHVDGRLCDYTLMLWDTAG